MKQGQGSKLKIVWGLRKFNLKYMTFPNFVLQNHHEIGKINATTGLT